MRQSSSTRGVRRLGTWPVLAVLTVAVLVAGSVAVASIRAQLKTASWTRP